MRFRKLVRNGVREEIRAASAEQKVFDLTGKVVFVTGASSGLGRRAAVASKGAVFQLPGAALDLARYGIRANAVCPGFFESEMTEPFHESDQGAKYIARTPAKRFGKPQDLDGAVLFFASEASAFMNGTHLVVDGGHSARLV